MTILLYIVFLAIAYFIGVFGFCQIIGTLQRVGTPDFSKGVFAMFFWTVIIVASIILMHTFFFEYLTAFYIGLAISLLMSLSAGKIE